MKSKNYSKLGLIEVVALLGGFQKANKTLKKELKKQTERVECLQNAYNNIIEETNKNSITTFEKISKLEKENHTYLNTLVDASKHLGGDRQKDDRYLSRSGVKEMIDRIIEKRPLR